MSQNFAFLRTLASITSSVFTSDKPVSSVVRKVLAASLMTSVTALTTDEKMRASIYGMYQNAKKKIITQFTRKQITNNYVIEIPDVIDDILTYMDYRNKFFDYILKDEKSLKKYLCQLPEPLNFSDTYFNVSGKIKFYGSNVNDKYTITKIVFIQCILPEKYLMGKYISDVIAWIQSRDANTEILYNYHKIGTQEVITTMYSGGAVDNDVLEKIYMKTIFHDKVDTLWERIKDIQFHPERLWDMGIPPRMNILLHGPPGTGKSSFAYRVAMATGRHIFNVKISNYTKKELMTVFQKPIIGKLCYKPNQVIFVLDEFDLDLETVLFNSNCQKQQIGKMLSFVEKFLSDLDSNNFITTPEKKSGKKGKKVKPKVYDSSSDEESDEPSVKSDEDSETNPEKNIQSCMSNIKTFMDSIREAYDSINKENTEVIRIEDLLTIFQGSVPIEGCIIMAMTNKYEEISQKCPQLFRAGRLTPIYFGNFNMKILNDVSKHYFGKGIDYECSEETELPVPPSYVMEIVAASSIKETGKYDYFVNELNKIIPNNFKPITDKPESFTEHNHGFSTLPHSSTTYRKYETVYYHKVGHKYFLCQCYHEPYWVCDQCQVRETTLDHCCGKVRRLKYFNPDKPKYGIKIIKEEIISQDEDEDETVWKGLIEINLDFHYT
jgi:DNA polymerase III delta prime subunit